MTLQLDALDNPDC